MTIDKKKYIDNVQKRKLLVKIIKKSQVFFLNHKIFLKNLWSVECYIYPKVRI